MNAQTEIKTSSLSRSELPSAPFFGAVFVGLSTTWWSQATGFEVYSLHAVLLTLVTLTFLRYLDDLGGRGTRSPSGTSCALLSTGAASFASTRP